MGSVVAWTLNISLTSADPSCWVAGGGFCFSFDDNKRLPRQTHRMGDDVHPALLLKFGVPLAPETVCLVARDCNGVNHFLLVLFAHELIRAKAMDQQRVQGLKRDTGDTRTYGMSMRTSSKSRQ